MKNFTIRTAIMSFALIISSTALQAMDLKHVDVDLNSDGKVTESEILSVIKIHFQKMDANSDSELSFDEWESQN